MNKLRGTILLTICIFLSGCEKDLNIEIPFKEEMFLISILKVNDSPFTKIGNQIPYKDSIYFDISCKTNVFLKTSMNTIELNKNRITNGICENYNDIAIVPNQTYSVIYKTKDKEISGSCKTPTIPKIDISLDSILGISIIPNATFNIVTLKFSVMRIDGEKFTSNTCLSNNFTETDKVSLATYVSLENKIMTNYKLGENKILGSTFSTKEVNEFSFIVQYKFPKENKTLSIKPTVIIVDDILKAYVINQNRKSEAIRDPFIVPIVNYSNINGGVGVVASYCEVGGEEIIVKL